MKTRIKNAVCSYALIALAKKRLNLERCSFYEVLQILRLTKFEQAPINQLLTPPLENSDPSFVATTACSHLNNVGTLPIKMGKTMSILRDILNFSNKFFKVGGGKEVPNRHVYVGQTSLLLQSCRASKGLSSPVKGVCRRDFCSAMNPQLSMSNSRLTGILKRVSIVIFLIVSSLHTAQAVEPISKTYQWGTTPPTANALPQEMAFFNAWRAQYYSAVSTCDFKRIVWADKPKTVDGYIPEECGGSCHCMHMRPIPISKLLVCPANSTDTEGGCACTAPYVESPDHKSCDCTVPGQVFSASANKCVPLIDVRSDPPPATEPCYGNPIYPLRGTKREVVSTGISIGGQSLALIYDTAGRDPGKNTGKFWRNSLRRILDIKASFLNITVDRGNGRTVGFELKNGSYVPSNASSNDELVVVPNGYRFTDVATQTVEDYDSVGKLRYISNASGNALSFTYSNASTLESIAPGSGYLIQITDNDGRNIRFEYSLSGRISRIIDTNSQAILLAYVESNNEIDSLTTLTWADGKTKTFLYENASLPWALTGIVDETQSRYATFAYNSTGQVISTEHAGGVDKFSVDYSSPPVATVREVYDQAADVVYRYHEWENPSPSFSITLPSGSRSEGAIDNSRGYPVLSGASQPAGSGCAASNNASTFDTNGNVLSKDNFQGERTCYAYNNKNQEIARVEGLATTASCAVVLASNDNVPVGARKITQVWHPDWRLTTRVTAPGSIVSKIYQGQPDPFNGNAIANCTSAGLMQNGKPLPLVCKEVTQATLASGSVDTSVPGVVNQYTYAANGRVLTSTDTMNRTTTFAYFAGTSFTGVAPNEVGHTIGDLQSITGPTGITQTFDSYDRSGRNLQSTAANGIVNRTTYSPRGWATSTSITPPGSPARVSTNTYSASGRLIGVSKPDGTTESYSYDAAGRLVGMSDSKGNSVVYTLDNYGNRTKEEYKNPQGDVQRRIIRTFDALNRLQDVSGATK